MTDPAGSDRLQQDEVPAGSATGAEGDLGSSMEDVPLTAEDAIDRDRAHPDEQPTRPGTDPSLAQRADPDGSA
jgi:hypothetical protein